MLRLLRSNYKNGRLPYTFTIEKACHFLFESAICLELWFRGEKLVPKITFITVNNVLTLPSVSDRIKMCSIFALKKHPSLKQDAFSNCKFIFLNSKEILMFGENFL